MTSARVGAAAGLRTGATALLSAASFAKEGEFTWVLKATGEALNGAARVVESEEGWNGLKADTRTALQNTFKVLPGVKEREAKDIAEGIVALVSVIRVWVS